MTCRGNGVDALGNAWAEDTLLLSNSFSCLGKFCAKTTAGPPHLGSTTSRAGGQTLPRNASALSHLLLLEEADAVRTRECKGHRRGISRFIRTCAYLTTIDDTASLQTAATCKPARQHPLVSARKRCHASNLTLLPPLYVCQV